MPKEGGAVDNRSMIKQQDNPYGHTASSSSLVENANGDYQSMSY
jgi:hypothetical protein